MQPGSSSSFAYLRRGGGGILNGAFDSVCNTINFFAALQRFKKKTIVGRKVKLKGLVEEMPK